MKIKIVSRLGKKSNKRFIALVIENGSKEIFINFDKVMIYELLPEEYNIKYLWENDCDIYI